MANPKLENGYTRIAHELLEAIMISDFTAAEYKVIFAVIRQTYGYQKKSAEISRAQFSRMCDLHFTSVSRAVGSLISKGVLIEKSSPGFAKCREVAINKNYHQWVACTLTDSANERGSAHATKGGSADATKRGSTHATHYKDKYKNTVKDREIPSLEELKVFAKENSVTEEVAEKFFRYYSARDWKTNGGTDVTLCWKEKLLEWQKKERPQEEKPQEEGSIRAAYDMQLIKEMLKRCD
jgi:phage replication O-like protein O